MILESKVMQKGSGSVLLILVNIFAIQMDLALYDIGAGIPTASAVG
jgi:hypothetical protein